MDPISAAIREHNADAYVMYASSRDADMRYLTQFTTSDPFVFFQKPNESGTIIVSQMEAERASRESSSTVLTRTQAGLPEILKTEKDLGRARARMIADMAGKKILVPPQFPVGLVKKLEEFASVSVDNGTVLSMRAKKTRAEITTMRQVQRITESAMEKAVSLIRSSTVKKGLLYVKGKPLTSEHLKFAMHTHLLEHGCSAVDTIVSCGEATAIPHMTGTGALEADAPIIIDIFPVQEKSGYYSDMTRTVVRGQPSREIREMYDTLREAKRIGESRTRAGAEGAEIHQAVVDYFNDQGYESNTKGFVHNLGHGVGLQIHELPTIGPAGKPLDKGNVVTIEPGLYYPGTGGVRLEDIGVVTLKGFEKFTRFSEELVV